MNEKLKIIITGSTGMVGEGVLHECLKSDKVDQILVINRKPCGITDPKLKEVIQEDMFEIPKYEEHLKGYDACFYCLGTSSLGIDKITYYKITYSLTTKIAEVLCKYNPDMVFCYVSGAGSDSTEQGDVAWARVKGKTENQLFKLPFKKAYAFRPSYIHPIKGLKNAHSFFKYIAWMYPIGRILFHNKFTNLKEIGPAMIGAALYGYDKQKLYGKDITALAKMIK